MSQVQLLDARTSKAIELVKMYCVRVLSKEGCMKQYYDRVISYDADTQNYKVSVPELGIEVLADTESNGLISIREEVEAAAKQNRIGPQEHHIKDMFPGDSFTIELPRAQDLNGKAFDFSKVIGDVSNGAQGSGDYRVWKSND